MARATKAKRVRQVTLPPDLSVLLTCAQIRSAIQVGQTRLDEMIAGDEFPQPDGMMGNKRVWFKETYEAWFAKQFRKG